MTRRNNDQAIQGLRKLIDRLDKGEIVVTEIDVKRESPGSAYFDEGFPTRLPSLHVTYSLTYREIPPSPPEGDEMDEYIAKAHGWHKHDGVIAWWAGYNSGLHGVTRFHKVRDYKPSRDLGQAVEAAAKLLDAYNSGRGAAQSACQAVINGNIGAYEAARSICEAIWRKRES